jgi:hypothetical protein
LKAIKQAQLREILEAYTREGISYSRMNEMLNELADKFAVGFGVWLTKNCTPANSEDGWWVYKDSTWLTTTLQSRAVVKSNRSKTRAGRLNIYR